jgi:transposase InsO family protein
MKTCLQKRPPATEPMMPSVLPNQPWEKVATDLFELKGKNSLLMVDYISRYPEVIHLSSTTSRVIIATMKSTFSRHGILKILVSDNGPQFTSSEMKELATSYGFQHITTSPYHPQSNGLAERMVKTVKKLFTKTNDPHLTLLSYRATPLPWCNLSPSELLMGRKVRTDVPQSMTVLKPKWSYLTEFEQKERQHKERQKQLFDQRHRVHPFPPLHDDDPVWVNTQGRQTPGNIVQPANTPRSYVIEVPSGQVRRNRSNLNPRLPESTQPTTNVPANEEPSRRTTRSQTGVPIHPPDRLTYWRKGDVA